MQQKGDFKQKFEKFSKEMKTRLEEGKKGLNKRTEKDNIDEVGNEISHLNTNGLTVAEDELTGMVAKLYNYENGFNTTLMDCSNTSKVYYEKNKNKNMSSINKRVLLPTVYGAKRCRNRTV